MNANLVLKSSQDFIRNIFLLHSPTLCLAALCIYGTIVLGCSTGTSDTQKLIVGTWKGKVENINNFPEVTIQIQADGEKLAGKYDWPRFSVDGVSLAGESQLVDPKFDGKTFSFYLDEYSKSTGDSSYVMTLTGQNEGEIHLGRIKLRGATPNDMVKLAERFGIDHVIISSDNIRSPGVEIIKLTLKMKKQ